MDAAFAAAARGAVSGGGGGGGSAAPFMLKTYEMVDDSSTDEIVSWSPSKRSFVVWNPAEFARLLLPNYFRHNNFSSFIRQLNTYGFHKIDPERWEFANSDFVKDKRHLLKNIHRRKPIHSHSLLPANAERAAFEEEMEKLSCQKAEIQAKALMFQEQQLAAKAQLEEVVRRLEGLEARHKSLANFLEKAIESSVLLEFLERKIDSMDLTAYKKRRRLPQAAQAQVVPENCSRDNPCCYRPELTDVFQQDFSDELPLELSPATSDINLVFNNTTQISNKDRESSVRRSSEGDSRGAPTSMSSIPLETETMELSDTGTSLLFNIDSSFPQNAGAVDSFASEPAQKNLLPTEGGYGHIPCHLNLTLASSPLQASHFSARFNSSNQNIGDFPETGSDPKEKRSDGEVTSNRAHTAEIASVVCSLLAAPGDNPRLQAAPAQVNDHFWEQFLTERPGDSYRTHQHNDHEGRGLSYGMFQTTNNLGKLTL